MTTWFKDGNKLFYSQIYARIYQTDGRGDSHGDRRFAILWHIIRLSANTQILLDCTHLAQLLSRPMRQCQRVWEICMAEGVLRQVEGSEGYSALEWMIENGYYGDNRPKEKKQYKPNPRPSGPGPTEPEPEPGKIRFIR